VKKGIFLSLLGLLAAASLIAGCGDGDETTSLTKAEFITQANAACKKSDQERNALFLKVGNELDANNVTKKDQERLIFEVLIPPYQKAINEIEALGAPAGDEKKVEEILKAMEGAIEKIESKPLLALTTNAQFAEANKLSQDYGLKDCVA
jgi:hypothetical protein